MESWYIESGVVKYQNILVRGQPSEREVAA